MPTRHILAAALFYKIRIFWCNSGLGLASVPDFWKTFHAGDCTVHRTEIASLSDENTINLENGAQITTDYVILCTGWTHNLGTFDEDLRAKIGLPSHEDMSVKWMKLDAMGEQKVNSLLPLLKHPPDTVRSTSERRPWRLYRRLISTSMASQGDHSILFPGQIHSVYTPLVAELQALWGVAFLLGILDLPDRDTMEEEVATWNAWTRKRYLEQGRKHAYSIYDFLAVTCPRVASPCLANLRRSTSIRLLETSASRRIARATPFLKCSRPIGRGTITD